MATTSHTYGPDLPGSLGYRASMRTLHALCLAHVTWMVQTGSTPQDVATYVLGLGTLGAGVSMWIEDVATDGSFAEAVFNILCD